MDGFVEGYMPKSRQDDIVIEGLGDETLVYDMRSHKAHCLNRTAALVWDRCDGKATVSEMAEALEKELRVPIPAAVVWLALEKLGKAELLSDRPPKSTVEHAISRRAIIRKIGLGAAVALPLVTSILAPSAADAGISGGCAGVAQPCSPSVSCCTPCTCSSSSGPGVCSGIC
jgi:Coenzyme PQQ synthesis protein D (PqqD)